MVSKVTDDYEGQLKFSVGKDSFHISSEGILLAHLNGKWSPICNETFGIYEADSSCRQLGCARSTYFGASNQQYAIRYEDKRMHLIFFLNR